MPRLQTILEVLLLICLAAGCKRKPAASGSANPQSVSPTTIPAGSAVIRGQIKFSGKPIPPNAIIITDPGCNCQETLEPGESIAPDGGLADAIVYLDVPPVGDGATRSTVMLDQIKCNYSPHVLAVQTHQPVIIKSSDPTIHNVRYQPARNASRNLSMATAGETFPTQFTEPEFIHFQCDVHPWMSAWVGVFNHPYFCVTDATGHFSIDHLPAGSYNVIVWHELLGTRRATVEVTDALPFDLNLDFNVPGGVK